MEISSNASTITIKGNIKSIENFKDIKTCLDNVTKSYNSVTLDIVDSMSITSSVIGYLTKLVHKNKIFITLKISDHRLYTLLEELDLLKLFHVKKV